MAITITIEAQDVWDLRSKLEGLLNNAQPLNCVGTQRTPESYTNSAFTPTFYGGLGSTAPNTGVQERE